MRLGHYDQLTDIFILGLILATLATGLDFSNQEDLENFIENRGHLGRIIPHIHPVIIGLIKETTELDRNKRCRDLYEIRERLENYRVYGETISIEEGISEQTGLAPELVLLKKLKNRLFDISRRNALLYFRRNSKFLNLTVASVPDVLNYQSINPDNLFLPQGDLLKKIEEQRSINLSQYLEFSNNPYIAPALNRIISEARKDKHEYGFSQLRLVIGMLHWHNLKENRNERIASPILLLPISIKKKKSLKDSFELQTDDNFAEVNPVLKFFLKDNFNIDLPDRVELVDGNITKLFEHIKKQIEGNNVGVSLDLIQKPRLKIIHATAKQANRVFLRRRGFTSTSANKKDFKDFEYSYLDEFNPLGVQVFHKKIQPSASALEFLLDEDIKVSHNEFSEQTKHRELFNIETSDQFGDPHDWEIDLTNVYIGNFNYKKMSLVRDYDLITEKNIQSEIFAQVFSPEAKQIIETKEIKKNIGDEFNIILADPTQKNAINFSKRGFSYIIQGPPGTGKSQTITNLIANYIAEGKKVLFISEKRAALDVVFYRLKQKGLDKLSAIIHDSQSDKKEFIRDLEKIYHSFLEGGTNFEEIKKKRNELIHQIEVNLNIIERFNDSMNFVDEGIGIPLQKFIARMVELKASNIKLEELDLERMPDYKIWQDFNEIINSITSTLEYMGLDPRLSKHPLSKLNKEIILKDNPLQTIKELIARFEIVITEFIKALENFGFGKYKVTKFEELLEFTKSLADFQDLFFSGLINIAFDENDNTRIFKEVCTHVYSLESALEKQREKNKNWKTKLNKEDLGLAMSKIRKHKSSLMSFLSSEYKKIKKLIEDSYDFSAHKIRPDYINVLEELEKEYQLLQEIGNAFEKLKSIGFTNPEKQAKLLNQVLDLSVREKEILKEVYEKFKVNHDKTLFNSANSLIQLQDEFELLIQGPKEISLEKIYETLHALRENLSVIPELLPALKQLNHAPESIHIILKNYEFLPLEIEAVSAQKSLSNFYRQNRSVLEVEGSTIKHSLQKIDEAYKQLFDINAKYLVALVKERFINNFNISTQSPSTVKPELREFRQQYSQGRKILEHEFSKKIRFKSVRELTESDSSLVIADLKPIWLMSPLSVSDTLPIDTSAYDVVIFDEASQITLEEAIPQFFRAKQAIVVGDEMQMPPTNFFSSSIMTEELEDDNQDDELISLDAESLLTQGARKLTSIMLGWHYRSKFESLISFSNSAFYHGNLLTIPDQVTLKSDQKEINVSNSSEAKENYLALLNRSISFHYIENGVYQNRTNRNEAEYIAELVRTLLNKNINESIGIVAFSQQQQSEIETALTNLSREDIDFAEKLEKEYERVEDDQFVGLFIKNLENVQGDERDIIIMSICYGYDNRGKMLMNFGPINRSGGEKRLNVIFSRAKKHMAVVSSIHHFDIKNEYNEGANYFRKFLNYAELVSTGKNSAATRILSSMASNEIIEEEKMLYVVTKEISEEIKKLGYEVENNVGQSYFKCDIAIREKGSNEYKLAILIDGENHYQHNDIIEQYYQKPSVLKAFGWDVIQVFTKDWYHNPEKIIKTVKLKLEGKAEFDERSKEVFTEKVSEKEEAIEKNENLIGDQGKGRTRDSSSPKKHNFDKAKNISTEISSEDKETLNTYILDITTAVDEHPVSEFPKKKLKSENNIKPQVGILDVSNINFRRFEFVNENSNKFWEVGKYSTQMVIKYGRIGTEGRFSFKIYASEEEAQKEVDKKISEKLKKGYKENLG